MTAQVSWPQKTNDWVMLDQVYQLDIASNFNDVADAPVAHKISDAVELHPRDDNEPEYTSARISTALKVESRVRSKYSQPG